MLNHIVTEAIGEHFAWQWRNSNSRTLTFKNIAKVLEIRIAPTDTGMAQLESGDVCSANNFVVGVHVAAHAVGAWILDLVGVSLALFSAWPGGRTSISRKFSGGP